MNWLVRVNSNPSNFKVYFVSSLSGPAPHTAAMPPGKRKAGMDDAPTEADVMDELARSMKVACDMQDTAAADRVYARFLSITGPGQSVVNVTVLPWALGKRKSGVEDKPSESGIPPWQRR